MIKLTDELKEKLESHGKKLIRITLEELNKDLPLHKKTNRTNKQ